MSAEQKPGFKSSLAGMQWRRYPPATRSPAPALAPIHGPDRFSTKVPSGEAAEVIAKVLSMRPARPPGVK